MTDETDDHNNNDADDALPLEPGDEPDEVSVVPATEAGGEDGTDDAFGLGDIPAAPRPINWRTLGSSDAEDEWLTLNEWVTWLRIEFGLPAAVIPPLWHRHPELVWELSALHLRWLGCYDPQQDAAGPLSFMTDFHAAQLRLREWVSISGTRLDRDRPTRQTVWPGEEPWPETSEHPIVDRDEDFVQFVIDDVTARAAAEEEFLRGSDDDQA
ncbi:hypothetical protein [Microbacterium rhizophilus]|uniref:hypothetical protein n=1 Tax=Microbacterium rhizophilus TaxID=3138934 RepID=UPI0031F1BEFF